ncbi:MAG: sulfurtransferase-like selenium metabolism protein YedF [Deltaproteobacteria bacterium]|nr:sulfurtransferase-like selenium metabolism protein YedF [Deltaproteobacteria bacterium]MBW2136760.1 sulfurtransferase-like selenium metabolism protein YedF [Deltaproteobacteria bacterium]
MNELDCRGLECPGPVLQTRNAVEAESPRAISVLVDNEAARENVARYLESQHFQATWESNGADFVVKGERDQDALLDSRHEESARTKETKVMVVVASDRMGRGDDELGEKLIGNFIKTLKEMGQDLWRLILLNSGVKLTTEGSSCLPDLKDLDAAGTSILVCGTCLDHFKLLDKKQVGETTNMLDIVTAMQLADKVINI